MISRNNVTQRRGWRYHRHRQDGKIPWLFPFSQGKQTLSVDPVARTVLNKHRFRVRKRGPRHFCGCLSYRVAGWGRPKRSFMKQSAALAAPELHKRDDGQRSLQQLGHWKPPDGGRGAGSIALNDRPGGATGGSDVTVKTPVVHLHTTTRLFQPCKNSHNWGISVFERGVNVVKTWIVDGICVIGEVVPTQGAAADRQTIDTWVRCGMPQN